MNIEKFGDDLKGLLGTDRADELRHVELRVEDKATGEYLKIDELAVDTERKNVFIVVNSDREGSGK